MAKLISGVYGDALFEAAAENRKISEIYEEVTGMTELLLRNQAWLGLMNHPKLSREERFSMMEQCLQNQVSEELMGFLKVVAEKGRQGELLSMLRHFIGRVKEYRKSGTAYVTSAVELEGDHKKRLEQVLLDKTGLAELQMYYHIEPEIIGGLIVRVGDKVVDSSVRSRLEEMKRLLNTWKEGVIIDEFEAGRN